MEYFSHFIGAALLVNSLPHFVMGVCARPFQSPFARPPGVGLSSPVSNVFWGGLNFLIGFVLVFRVGALGLGENLDLLAVLAGAWGMGFFLARYFGRVAKWTT